MENRHIDTILEFLNTVLESSDCLFEKFSSLPGAILGCGDKPLQRYVYVPGKREDRVLLVAHIDTIWDKAYRDVSLGERAVIFDGGVFRSSNPDCGIGADDRAGCAMLWELREGGHSLLIVDGEEHGKIGARYLKKYAPKLFHELNRHSYIIELDWAGTDGCLFNQVDNTKKFKKYIEDTVGFCDSKASGGTDLQVLCRDICGVNIGVGYHGQHTNGENLILSEWENTLGKLSKHLMKQQQRFRISVPLRCIRLAKRCINKALRILKIKKPSSNRKEAKNGSNT